MTSHPQRRAAIDATVIFAASTIAPAPPRRLLLLVIFLALLGGGARAVAQSPHVTAGQTDKPKVVTVYVTRAGKKYHRAGCRSLGRSSIPISLKDAKARGYTACKLCHPPE